jgi:hypothetical protein
VWSCRPQKGSPRDKLSDFVRLFRVEPHQAAYDVRDNETYRALLQIAAVLRSIEHCEVLCGFESQSLCQYSLDQGIHYGVTAS